MIIIREGYKEAVEDYAKNKKNYLFHNEGNEHALIILKNIFNNASSHIRIAANNLFNNEVVNTREYINSVRNFLNYKKSKLDILLTDIPSTYEMQIVGEFNFYRFLYNHPAYEQQRITIKNGQGRSFKKDNKPIHFCTADGIMYRLENDITKRKAICNFGDENTTKMLEKIFDNVFNNIEQKWTFPNLI